MREWRRFLHAMVRRKGAPFTTAATTTSSSSSQQPNRRDNAGIVVFSSICLGAAGLGVWQMQRYSWKINVIDEISRRLNEPPESIPAKLTQYELAEYVEQIRGRVLKITGTFDHTNEILMGPRSAPAGLIGTAAQGLAINPQGYYVITPLIRNDGTIVFINRGWVAINEKNWHRPRGLVTVSTVISKGEKRNTFSPENNPTTKRLFWLEEDALRVCANRPELTCKDIIVLEAFEPDDVPVTYYPAARRQKHLTEQHVTPLMHLVYAFTWFSLSAAGFVMTFSKFRKPSAALARRVKMAAQTNSNNAKIN